ncbi:monovalent cation/H(+) antiporter subunit G [Streptomyces sp. NBC_01476]|uniref:cation:proton antiporter n=1 Tax=Streptomyces sp. NBC_01476 TaxID=2903881 RepID=UPI002E33991A|nr:monovalent cation/H(+) antiporter subunit G [Streptomyces sp. NBC_01476]
MDVRHGFAVALLVCGMAALLLSALALLALPTPYARLHALSPAASLGVPLICLALALDAGPGRAALKLLFIGALTAVSGPVVTIVIGRTMAREGEQPGGDAPGEPPA